MNFRARPTLPLATALAAAAAGWLIAQAPAVTTAGSTLFAREGGKNSSRLKGDFSQGPAGRILAKNLQLETLSDREEPEMRIEAPECLIEPTTKSANSSGPLKVSRADGLFSIEGQGFAWDQTNKRLVISNKVRAVIRRQLFGTRISAKYWDSTKVNGPLSPAHLVMTSHPTFVRAAILSIGLAAIVAAIAAGPVTLGPDETEITAVSFVFDQRMETVHFEHEVRVWNPGIMTLTCDDLVARVPRGGGVESIVATTGVRIEFIRDGSTNYATGDRAVYTKTNEVLVLTSQPGAPMPELNREGMNIRAEKITLDLGRGSYRFEGTQSKPVLRGKLGAFSKFDPFGSKTNEPAKSK